MTQPLKIAYILAGGTSKRFGSDKALYWLHGARMLDHVARSLEGSVDEIVIVRGPHQSAIQGYRNIYDNQPERGPLAGIAAALRDAQELGGIALTVGCDLLGLRSEWVQRFADRLACEAGSRAAAFRDEHWQADLAIWDPSLLSDVEARLESDNRSLQGALNAHASALELPAGWGGVTRANTVEAAESYFAMHSPMREVTRGDGTSDRVAVEEPLEIRVQTLIRGHQQSRPISITMRSPGDDLNLAIGFLFGEGIVTQSNDIKRVLHCDDGANPNVINVEFADHVSVDFAKLQRNFYTTSSCGVCGKTSLEALAVLAEPVERIDLSPHLITELPNVLRANQPVFEHTGAIHGAGLFTPNGQFVDVREDIGRHNALDKLVGARVRAGKTFANHVVCLSGRASFELMQKALVARAGAVVAVGAPSSLAVELARANNMALFGFVRGEAFNEYA